MGPPETERTGPVVGAGPTSTIRIPTVQQPDAGIGHILRGRSVIAAASWFQSGTPEQRKRFADAVQAGRRTAAHQRDQVLAHPDLAAQLVRRLGYQRPDQWNGYVPPRWFESGGITGERWIPNDSPARAVLVELVAEAAARAVAS